MAFRVQNITDADFSAIELSYILYKYYQYEYTLKAGALLFFKFVYFPHSPHFPYLQNPGPGPDGSRAF
jgi:hypothetical protein